MTRSVHRRFGAAIALSAAFDYSMPDRFEVPEPPAATAISAPADQYFSGPVRPDHWTIELNACDSTGAITSYEWLLDGAPLVTTASCDGASFEADSEGAHEVTLRVHGSEGESTLTRTVQVQDWLVVGLGDSYGSGEGNPDVAVSASQINALQTAQQALAAAELAAAQQLAAYALAEQDFNAIMPLLLTAISRYNAWIAAANAVTNNCPFPIVACAQAEAAYVTAGAQLTAALVPLGLQGLFGESTLLGVISNLKDSTQHALDLAKASRDAALAARAAARAALASSLEQLGPRWQGRQCHRSAKSGQVKAAKLLEDADPHTSVTFIHLACSGAKIWEGLLESYAGQEKIASESNAPAQANAAADLTAGREVDALVVSIGGNDVKFSKVIESCMENEPCYAEPATSDPALAGYLDDYCAPLGPLAFVCHDYFLALHLLPPSGSATGMFLRGEPLPDDPNEDDHRLGLDDLPANYDAFETRLDSLVKAGGLEGLIDAYGRARVYLTAYPSITRREPATPGGPTEPCGFDPSDALSGRLRNLPGLSQPEILWAENEVAPALADAMRTSSLTHGWRFVDSHVASFDGHGYCADDNWIERIPESIHDQLRPTYGDGVGDAAINAVTGTAHPNQDGHQAYAAAIFGSLLCDLYPGCDPTAEPRAQRLAPRLLPGAKLVVTDNARNAAKRKIELLVKSGDVEAPAPGAGDPTQLGGVLRIGNPRPGGDDARFVLPAARWKGLGKPAGSKGWSYSDSKRRLGPCTSVVVKPGASVKATCKGAAIPFTLDEDAQESLGVSLTLGEDSTQCLEFGGTVKTDRPAIGRKSGSFDARNAPAPAECPLP